MIKKTEEGVMSDPETVIEMFNSMSDREFGPDFVLRQLRMCRFGVEKPDFFYDTFLNIPVLKEKYVNYFVFPVVKQAFVWNSGSCHFGVKGDIQVKILQELEYQYKIQRRITP